MSRRRTGRARTAAQRMRRMRALRKAQGLRPVVTWVAPDDPALVPSFEARLHEARVLANHVMIVAKINRDPGLLEIVHRNFERWQQPGRCASGHALRAWRKAFRLKPKPGAKP